MAVGIRKSPHFEVYVCVFQNDCGYGGMVDTGDLKSPALRVPVRVRVPVPKEHI